MSPDPNDSDIDRALKRGLSALAPDVAGDDDALTSLRPRFRRARTRNRVAKIGGTMVALAAIASVAALAAPSSGRTHVRVTSPVTTAPDRANRPVRSSTTTSSTTSSVPAGNGPVATIVSTVPHTPNLSGSSPTTAVAAPGTTPGTAPHGDDNGSFGGGGGHGRGGPSPGTTNPAQDGVKTYHSAGGSVTVRYSHGDLSLLSVTPANGYRASTHRADPDDIDVRFENDHGGWRVRVRVEDGRVTGEVDRT